MKIKKKKKDEFKEFRNNEKSAYKTFKIPLKTILLNRETIQPVINHLVFEMNDLVIHTYQFIRLYVLYQYTKNLSLPALDETFILYCIKTLGTRYITYITTVYFKISNRHYNIMYKKIQAIPLSIIDKDQIGICSKTHTVSLVPPVESLDPFFVLNYQS